MPLLSLRFLAEPAFLVYLKLLVFPQLGLLALMAVQMPLVVLVSLVSLELMASLLLVSPLQVIPMSLLFLSFLAEPAFLVYQKFLVFLLLVFPQLGLLALTAVQIPLVVPEFLVVQVAPLFLRLLVLQALMVLL